MFEQLGLRIREKRDFLKISREAFSEIIGITADFLAQIESGKRGMSLATFYKICKALNVSSDYLLTGKETKNDITEISEALRNIDPRYMPYVEDVLRSVILLIDQQNKA